MPAPPLAQEPPPHLLIAFASASAPACRAALPRLPLPNLDALLAELVLAHTDSGDDHSLNLPHERALAQALGLAQADGRPCGDGLLPWAAAHSADPGLPQAWFTPCHFQVDMEQVRLLPGAQLGLSEADSRALCQALQPFCAADGIDLRFHSPHRWHASGAALRAIACASLDRVSGRPVHDWMPESPANPAGSRLLKRLASEAQLLFYAHPINDAREAAHLPGVNGFWVSAAGALEVRLRPLPPPTRPDSLRQAALREDWSAWQQAWAELDRNDIPPLLERVRRGAPVTLTLCGERSAQRWVNGARGTGARLGRHLKRLLGQQTPAWKILETL